MKNIKKSIMKGPDTYEENYELVKYSNLQNYSQGIRNTILLTMVKRSR